MATSLDATWAIEHLDSLLGKLNQKSAGLRCEAEDISEQWGCLGNAGGQRADHAATLMSRLRPHLRDIAAFCQVVESQIDGMVADPFGRGS